MSFIYPKIIQPYLKSHWHYIILYLVSISIIFWIIFLKLPIIFSNFVQGKSNSYTDNYQSLMIIFIFFVLLSYLKVTLEKNLILDLSSNSRSQALKQLFDKLRQNYQEIPESEISYISMQILWMIREVFKFIFDIMVPFLFLILIILIFTFTHKPDIFYIFGIHLILLGVLFYLFSKISIQKYWNQNEQIWIQKCGNLLGDKFKNLLNIISENNINSELSSLERGQQSFIKNLNNTYNFTNKNLLVYDVLLVFTLLVIIAKMFNFKNRNNTKNNVIIPSLLIILIIYFNLYRSFTQDLTFKYHSISKLITIDRRLHYFSQKASCVAISSFFSIKLKNVYFRYQSQSPFIIKNLSLEIKPRKLNIIMGPTGVGKTTIMKLLIKLYNPTKGQIWYGQQNGHKLCQTDILKFIYYVNQKTILFNETILKNIQYGTKVTISQVQTLLSKYQLDNYFNSLKEGLNNLAGVNGSNLSLGMQKVITVVRGVLHQDKNIIIFDEPLSSLDKGTRKKIILMITQEIKNKTIVVITHDDEIVKFGDHLIYLK